jgi:hypothetical protein
MQYSVTNSTVKRELSASRRCQLPLDSPDCSLELTYIHTHPRNFTQPRFQGWNPILLCRCLGSVYSSPICVYFRPLTLLQTLAQQSRDNVWRSISRGSAYRLVNGAVIGSLLTTIIAFVGGKNRPFFLTHLKGCGFPNGGLYEIFRKISGQSYRQSRPIAFGSHSS